MENGIGIAEDAKLAAGNAVDSEGLERSVVENVVLCFDGSNGSGGDEVFEEAVEAETPIAVSEKSMMIDGRDDQSVGSLQNNENTNLSDEVRKFEELSGALAPVHTSEDFGPMPEPLMCAEYPDEKQIAGRNENNGLMDDSILAKDETTSEVGKGDYAEVVDSVSAGTETENLNCGNDLNENLDKLHDEPEVGISNNLSLFETLTADDAKNVDADTREKLIIQVSENLTSNDSSSVENLQKPNVKNYTNEMTEIQEVCEVKGCDMAFKKPENGSLDHANFAGPSKHEDTKIAVADSIGEQIHEMLAPIEDANVVEGCGVGPMQESDSNRDVLENNRENVTDDLSAAILDSRQQEDKLENTEAALHAEFKEYQVGEQENDSLLSHANSEDDEDKEMKKLEGEDVHEKRNSTVAVVVDDSTANPEIPEIEEPYFSSSELVAENSSSSLRQLVDASAKASTSVIEGTKQEVVEDEKKHDCLSGNAKQEVRPMNGISSSSANSSTSGLTAARPPGHEHLSTVQGPFSQEQEIKTTAEISSSTDSVKPLPGGLSTSPSEKPASHNIERGSTAAADRPSANATSATPARPAGLGRAAPLLEPASRVVQHPRVNGAVSPTQNQLIEDPTNGEGEEYDETREKLQMIRVKFLRLAHRLGQTPHNVVVAQVLYRLGLAEQLRGRSGGRVAAFSFDRASAVAEQLEASGQEPLDFTCTIMVLGKSGVGKSATINSIFDEVMFGTDAFHLGTKQVQDIVGTVQGIRVRVIDTPGLLPSWSDQRQNEKILRSVKRFIKKTPPDIVLYLDRLDMQSRDFGDMPLLQTITEIFGPSIWFNAIVVLTHAASAPPEGPNGTTTSYDMFVTQRSHVVQQAIRQAAGDMRLMNPVSLVENHSACRTNRAGQRVLPNGQVWKPHLLLLSFASKILAEANTLLKLQDSPPGRPFTPRTRSPPLPFLLSSLLQSRPEVKLPSEEEDDDDALGDDLDECSDSEEESEYDELPPFKSLTRAQLEKLTKVQRKAYYDELEYREKLFMKKQLKEKRRRRKMMKKMQEAARDLPADHSENAEEEAGSAASISVPVPDLALPASFDSDNPTHRYRSLDSYNPWLVRPVLEPSGWDHDIGYDGINVERLFVIKDKVPLSLSGHISKEKKDASLQMEVASSVKHGKGRSTSLGFDMQSVGKDIAYTLRSETRFSNHRLNKASAGLSATFLGDILTGGLKVEDKLIVGKRGQLVVSGGAMYGRGEVAYGGSLEATLRDKDHPLGRFLSTLGLSVMDWHGDLAIGCNSHTQIPIGRHTNLIGRFNINNRGSGQLSVRVNSSEQLQIVLIGLIPLLKKVLGYSQQVQYG